MKTAAIYCRVSTEIRKGKARKGGEIYLPPQTGLPYSSGCARITGGTGTLTELPMVWLLQ